MKPDEVLRSIGDLIGNLASSYPAGPWQLVLGGLSAGAGLASDLIARGSDPVASITAIRSALPSFAAADAKLEAMLEQLVEAP